MRIDSGMARHGTAMGSHGNTMAMPWESTTFHARSRHFMGLVIKLCQKTRLYGNLK